MKKAHLKNRYEMSMRPNLIVLYDTNDYNK